MNRIYSIILSKLQSTNDTLESLRDALLAHPDSILPRDSILQWRNLRFNSCCCHPQKTFHLALQAMYLKH